MTDSYILYLETDLALESVLEIIFQPKSIAPIDGTDMLYARGSVFLAHAQILSEALQEKYHQEFDFSPTISIRYFPDGVSSVKTALSLLADGILYWLHHNHDNLILTANKVNIIARHDDVIRVTVNHSFWRGNQLAKLDLPYSEVSS